MMTESQLEWTILTSDQGQAFLEDAKQTRDWSAAWIERWRKQFRGKELVQAGLRLASGRLKGLSKFSRSDQMWLHPVGAEQATSELVAEYKAKRFQGLGKCAVDLCCGVGGDAVALARMIPTLAVDMNHDMCRRTTWNAKVYGVESRLLAIQANAQEIAIPSDALVHIDPDRRASGTRTLKIEEYQPGLSFLQQLARGSSAIKLSPASNFADHFSEAGYEQEVISLNGECKETVIWTGSLAHCRRQATCLPQGAICNDRDVPYLTRAKVTETPQSWLHELDPALVRVGLADGFAVQQSCLKLVHDSALCTSGAFIHSPWVVNFEVIDTLSYDLKRLRQAVRLNPSSSLEVKTRGVSVMPESVRKELKFAPSAGYEPLFLFLAQTGNRQRLAILARMKKFTAMTP